MIASQPTMELQPGTVLHGFRVVRVTTLEDLRMTVYQLEHVATGARLLHLYADDDENLFAIAFPTPPSDSTGLPHILEHSVLDGSHKYPAKKPFFEMVKMSMATFINAMTYADKTVYPVASNVEQDFYNLAEVYCDAVFHPRLTEETLMQEGHRLDFATSGDVDSDLIIKGIVYNEMKGALSSPDSLVYYRTSQWLFPDTTYGKQSGGDPDFIPDLTYANFCHFHREFYHPSNAYIFLYGNIPTERHLKFLEPQLEGFERRDQRVEIPRQPRWTEPRARQEVYPIEPGGETAGKTYLNVAWLVGDATDAVDMIAWSLLDLVLLGNQAAPLRKALVDSKLGEDLAASGYSGGILESTFRIGLKGSEPDREHAFLSLVMDTLTRIADEGIPPEKVEAAFQQLSYRYLEIQSSYPLTLMGRVYNAWIYGGDPLSFLRGMELLQTVHEAYEKDPGIFGRMIREKLLENPHRLTTVFSPDPELQARKDKQFADQMAVRKAALTEEELNHVAETAAKLEKLQSTPNSPEDLASLPQLQVSDVPRHPKHIDTAADALDSGLPLLRNNVFSQGVNYLQVDVNLEGLPEDLFPYLSLYGDCVRKMGAAGMDYEHIAERVAAHTGGISFWNYFTFHVTDAEQCLKRGRFALRALDSQAADAMGVLRDLIFSLDFRDEARLHDILLQARAVQRSSLASNGLGIAMSHAGRSLNVETYLSAITDGLPQIRLIERLCSEFDAMREETIVRLEAIREFMLESGRLTASFTGSDSAYETVRNTLQAWAAGMRKEEITRTPLSFEPSAERRREALAAPMDVAYCAEVIPAPHISHPDAPVLAVAGQILSLDYMMEQVRVKGGAYGGGCGHIGSDRIWRFFSYRDPWIVRTLEVFDGLAGYVRNASWSQTDVDRAIIGTAKAGERPIRPSDATGAALTRYVVGDTRELREQRHAAVLDVTPEAIRRAVGDLLEENRRHGGVCVVSGRNKIEAENERIAGDPLPIEDILTP